MIEANEGKRKWLPSSRAGKLRTEDRYNGRSRVSRYDSIRDRASTLQSGNFQSSRSRSVLSRVATLWQNKDINLRCSKAQQDTVFNGQHEDDHLTVMDHASPYRQEFHSEYQQKRESPEPRVSDTQPKHNCPSIPAPRSGPTAGTNLEQHDISPQEELLSILDSFAIEDAQQQPEFSHACSMPDPASRGRLSISPTTTTWNEALNQILRNETADEEMKKRVRERVRSSQTANGNGEEEHLHISGPEVGIVPNFSYPVAASAFFDGQIVDLPPLPSAAANQYVGNQSEIPRSSPGLYDFDFGLDHQKAIPSPSVHSLKTYPSTPPASPRSTPSFTARPPRDPSSRDSIDVAARLKAFLELTLPKSQINLLNTILATPVDDAPTSNPTLLLLVKALYHHLLHVQDRALYLEDMLVPRMGAGLERKTYTIDVLSVEIQSLNDKINELKKTVDCSTAILAGCWLREYELWRTLTCIREGRGRAWWNLRRNKLPDGVLSPDAGQRFSGRELDALLRIAKQNVHVLREDVDDMVEQVEACKRTFTPFPAVEVQEGSWRDV
ncbi:hypothetical protein ACEQ8H_008658 [Pleosporales sp. CAS-2024a]